MKKPIRRMKQARAIKAKPKDKRTPKDEALLVKHAADSRQKK